MVGLSDCLITRTIYHRQTYAFKVNASVCCILINNATGKLRYFYSCWSNNPLFETAQAVTAERHFLDNSMTLIISSQPIVIVKTRMYFFHIVKNITIMIMVALCPKQHKYDELDRLFTIYVMVKRNLDL